ncbi:ABC transporter ATP-binding protein [Nioella ostreopsis]|jgi:oligopeptide/dipeptide ABC transporter ATP-binding protein|uniref:ABC transporter ATP-binding protein n=1 Tax=Nioella ostreopsis TaxID=2448479 RepID=UPI000FDC65BA|nr:ABC transporter ATP-binding protein [Nioella ostreopsis]
MTATPLMTVEDLSISFRIEDRWCRAVNGVSFDIMPDETLCLVGESGCGKSITAMSLMRLLPGSARLGGRIGFDGKDILTMPEAELQTIRGRRIAMIFQEPMTSLNPVLTVGEQIAEPLVLHKGMGWAEAKREARHLLDLVRIPDADRRLRQYPYELSGGMRQRVMIAIGLACRPEILIADEPTTALDVTIQAQVLALLDEIRREQGLSIVLITHDLGVVANVADRVAVMYAGDLVETAPAGELFDKPSHPYTQALLRTVPRADAAFDLHPIEGQVPSIQSMPEGCRFAPRCGEAHAACSSPPNLSSGPHAVRCWARRDVA